VVRARLPVERVDRCAGKSVLYTKGVRRCGVQLCRTVTCEYEDPGYKPKIKQCRQLGLLWKY